MTDVEMVTAHIADQWPLLLPKYRAERGETWGSWWPYWERPRLESMRRNLHLGDVVYDIGAEEGDWPALWASWGCDVFMAEPNPRVWPNIKAIFEANQLTERVVGTYAGFVGDLPRYAVVDRVSPPRDVRSEWPPSADGPMIGDHGFCNLDERPDIPATTIDEIVVRIDRPPTAITMDIEGAELRCLQGAEQTLAAHRPLLWISVHPWILVDMYGSTPADVEFFLTSHGYLIEHLAAEHEFHWFAYPVERTDVVLPYGPKPRPVIVNEPWDVR